MSAAVDDDLCLSRLITYASDQGKKYPMAIGEDYTDDVRHQMADFLVMLDYKQKYFHRYI